MLAAILFIAFWVVVALGVFFIAIRGGVGGARAALRSQTRGGRLVLSLTMAAVYLAFGIGLPIGLLVGNHANASKQVGGLKLTRGEKTGRALFGAHCGVCHTLAAANAVGKVGPNLDQIAPSEALVLRTIQNGCLQNAPTSGPGSTQTCLGQGTMPAGILQGRDAIDVAQFVARVAGKE
jgi:mono/diheme cytochrome c family protein